MLKLFIVRCMDCEELQKVKLYRGKFGIVTSHGLCQKHADLRMAEIVRRKAELENA